MAMRKKIYHLGTCSTCVRIIKDLQPGPDVELQDIKTQAMTAAQVDEMGELAGSFEALFSRRSQKYKAWELASKTLTEADFRRLILEEYTFLKRPVILVGNEIFIGNAAAPVAAAKAAMSK
jgi:arsenate reductase (glutaredoxin)